MRLALNARLQSQVESGISQYKQRGLANPGATRARTIDLVAQEC